MPSNTRIARETSSPVMFEALEARELMSATVVHAATPSTHEATTVTHAELVAEAAAKKAAAQAKAAAAKAAAQAKAAAAKAAAQAAKLAAAQAAAAKAAAKKAAVVETAVQPVSSPVSGTIGQYISSPQESNVPNFVGTWTGTIQLDGSTTSTPFSIAFAFQRGVAASGTFNLGPIMGNQSELSTLIYSSHNVVRALIQNSTLWVGFTGAISTDGKTIFGRFAYNTPHGWETGSFSVTRNS